MSRLGGFPMVLSCREHDSIAWARIRSSTAVVLQVDSINDMTPSPCSSFTLLIGSEVVFPCHTRHCQVSLLGDEVCRGRIGRYPAAISSFLILLH